MKPTSAAWALFFTGYIILMITDIVAGVPYRVYQGVIYALILPSLYLLYRGSRGKGGMGLRVLIVITHFWLGYALASLIALLSSLATG